MTDGSWEAGTRMTAPLALTCATCRSAAVMTWPAATSRATARTGWRWPASCQAAANRTAQMITASAPPTASGTLRRRRSAARPGGAALGPSGRNGSCHGQPPPVTLTSCDWVTVKSAAATVNSGASSPPAQLTSQVMVAVTRNAPPGCPSEGWV